jgi:hypothetical protein
MGFRTEINYIVKSNSVARDFAIRAGDVFTVFKKGQRVYIMNQPLMFADVTWCVRGMCEVVSVEVKEDSTLVCARILTVFTDEESKLATQILSDAYKALTPRNETDISSSTSTDAAVVNKDKKKKK